MTHFSRHECSHLANILLHYITIPNSLEETVIVVPEEVTITTQQLLAKAVEGALYGSERHADGHAYQPGPHGFCLGCTPVTRPHGVVTTEGS